ncbi:ret finger protein-like 3 isoform X1 [Oryctolagus cuniculus]|uniref:ret finger protein-like 3 isoform X1 n=2 Tax=Oryctolagus cuniculus TaxID=9986 RepID=UPI003879D9DB
MPVTICDVSSLMTGIKAAVSWSCSRVTITLWLDSLSLLSASSHSLPCVFPPAADMAELLQKMCRCLTCPAYLEQPLSLECGCSFCPDCVRSLPQEPHGEGLVCSFCTKVSRKNHLRPNRHLGQLVSKVKELEPQLRAVLQMNPRMRRFRVDVTLDADTANNFLILSDDLKSIWCGPIRQNRPALPSRFDLSVCVLGTPQFVSGRHYWEVDVGLSTEWNLGVCRDSVCRQGRIQLSSEQGFWTLSRSARGFFWASTTPHIPLCTNSLLHQVGIFLDVDVGNVSFYCVENEAHIFTFTGLPAGEPLRPFFALSIPPNGVQGALSMCPIVRLGDADPSDQQREDR